MTIVLQVRASRGDFDLDIAFESDARIIAIEGPSGAGKTTFLQGLAGLIPVKSAELAIDGRSVVETTTGRSPAPHRRRIGYVFQEPRLFPHLTVTENIGFGRRFAANPISVDAALSLVDLDDFGSRWPGSLSGGEQRRVAIARALCADPQILFLDEPFAGLDADRRDRLAPYLHRLKEETGLPILLVSHDPRDIAALADVSIRVLAGRRVLSA